MTRIAVTGAAGRMGRRIAALAIESDGAFELVAAAESPDSEAIGADIGELAGAGPVGVKVAPTLDAAAEVLIDFSTPAGAMNWLASCRGRNIAMVIGTTGLSEPQLADIADAAATIPIVCAANMSVGVNILLKVAARVAAALGEDYDVEISETHHRFKQDAPSGTAIALAKAICASTGRDYTATAVHGRGAGRCPRTPGEIGIHAMRVGDTVGEHAVHFGNLGETLTLGHSAHTRDTFARGALRAAGWIVGKKPGLYSMLDVLGLA